MELLEGATLKHSIGGRPLPLDQLLDLAIQIADALQAAHSAGVVHRDRRQPYYQPGRDAGYHRLHVTGTGERRGSRYAHDLFSFGLVLYEMATGRMAFSGNTAAVIFDGILHHDTTSPMHLNPDLSPRLGEIIAKALEKKPDLRYQHAAEMHADLKRLKRDIDSGRNARAMSVDGMTLTTVLSASDRTAAPAIRPRLQYWSLMLAGSFALLLAPCAIFWFTARQRSFVPELKQRQVTANSTENAIGSGVISPDGKYLAYTDWKGIHLKVIDTGETQTIPQPQALKGRSRGLVNRFLVP
jgi:eukaryotic-like serine/threonine-protein kinase